jgi:hypothetical protein
LILVRFIEIRVMPRFLEPDKLFVGRFQCLEIGLGQTAGGDMIASPDKEVHRHFHFANFFREVSLHVFGPHYSLRFGKPYHQILLLRLGIAEANLIFILIASICKSDMDSNHD